MRYMVLILSLILPAGLPGHALGLDLFCFNTVYPSSRQAPSEQTKPVPDLRQLLLSSPRTSRTAARPAAVTTSFALQLDERTHFGITSYSPGGGDHQEEAGQDPIFGIGLNGLLD
ncbi:hypothetical protein [Geothermobacter hydrogeniphilus]|uniref:Uncharacterized protein n=1 Tax=Geothermobacter hydrogeniphilus TaxID=1969733 RepID=A0A1X0XPU8_9BACT|nr:hypothetical protein [Geothermobacter hydrogeniphilus]ORJ54906.1 hypothetical protein B5V00_15550 [Geothermobacter hydrogeniphilus]